MAYWYTTSWGGQWGQDPGQGQGQGQGPGWQGQGVFFLSPSPAPQHFESPEGQFWLWSPLMIFALVMAILVGLILLGLLIYSLFYFCMYGTCFCPGAGCFCCPHAPVPPPEEPVKVRIRRPSRSESCRSSTRSRRSSCSHYDDGDDDRRMVRINSCPSISGSCGGPQPVIIQTIPAFQAPTTIQPIAPPPPPVCSCQTGGCGGGCRGRTAPSELRVVIGEPQSAPSGGRAGSVMVYDMAGRSNGGGVSLGNGRSEYVLTSVDDHGGYGRSGAFNDGFDKDEGGSCFSDGHRSAIIDIGKGGGQSFYPSLPRYDD